MEVNQLVNRKDNIPEHIAIIMDGNGRWAKKRHLPRLMGHRAGVAAVEKTVKTANTSGIKYLSLYAFSSENWTRPEKEVHGLMLLFKEYISRKITKLRNENVRLRFAGRRNNLPEDVINLMDESMEKTMDCNGLNLIICLNYGGRNEIIDAVNKILSIEPKPEYIDEKLFHEYLYLPDIPDPDLIIRTSGEKRLSNYWLWQSSYSEFYFPEVLWPDFGEDEFNKALYEFSRRERRYGNLQNE